MAKKISDIERLSDALNIITDQVQDLKKEKKSVAQKIIENNKTPIVEHGEAIEIKKRHGLKWGDRWRIKNKPATAFLIYMRYSNGTCKIFIINAKNETFNYKGRTYYLRYEDAWYNLSYKQYVIDFHEDYAVPIDRKIVQKEDPNADTPLKKKAYFTVTSSNLKPLLKMEYIKALAQSTELTRYLKLALVVGLINTLFLLFTVYQLYQIKPLA